MVFEPGLLVTALVGDVPVALQVGVRVNPVQRSSRLKFQLADKVQITSPPLVFVKEHDIERVASAEP